MICQWFQIYSCLIICRWHQFVLHWREIEYSCWQYQSWTDESIHMGESKLTLHSYRKNKLCAFYPKMFPRAMEHIVIDGHRIEEVSQTKFLGVILDNKLNRAAHCNYICCEMSKGIGIIIKAREVFNETTLLSLYQSGRSPKVVALFLLQTLVAI